MNSKRFLKSLLMMAMLAFVGCETDGTEDNNNPGGGNDDDTTYTVVVNPPALFQVDGAEEDSEGEFEVAWASDTKFSVYVNNGDWVDDFEVSDLDNLKFSALSEDTDLNVGVKYIAVYPARQNEEATYSEYVASFDLTTQSQSGSSTDHLLSAIQLSDTFYGGDDITFEHNTAILKLSFAEVADETPESVTFEYGTYSYTLSLSNMVSAESTYTAYMMIDEREQGEYVETFSVDYSGDSNDIVSIANSSADYLSGYIYELTLESKDEVPYSLTANAPEAYSNGVATTWDDSVVFSVYEKNGAWVDNFTVSDLGNSEFNSASTETELDSATEYIAVYPARSSTDEDTYAKYIRKSLEAQAQTGATADHLNDLCQASAEFKGGEEINFAYESAIVEVSFEVATAAGTPQTLTLSEGANSYKLTIGDVSDGTFTAYIMVSPITNGTDVTYTVDYGGDDNTSDQTIATAVDYAAGGVYAQTIDVAAPADEDPYEITATLPVAYENGFALVQSWVNGNSFTLCKKSNDSEVDTFTYNDQTSKFESSSFATELSADVDYVATYSLSSTIDLATQTQTGDSNGHLADYSQMSTEFKGGETAAFTYDYAILAVTFTSTETPNSLTLTNETSSAKYLLTLDNYTSVDNSYTAYLTIDPMEAESQLTYLISSGASTVTTYSTTLATGYEAGVSYTQTILAEEASSITAIYTADDLVAYISSPTADAILMNDIDFGDRISQDAFTPVTLTYEFDGNNNTISDFSYDGASAAAGLFLYVNNGGVVKNLTMQSPSVSGGTYVGAIAGQMAYGATITGCNVYSGTITASSGYVGGIAGQAKDDISNCTFSGNVSSGGNNAGGIVGLVTKDTSTDTNPAGNCPTIDNCTSSATISNFEKENGGGIAGKGDNSTISNCSFSGTITGTSTTASKNIGGIVGYLATTTTINCSNSGTVSSAYIQFGGIAGNVDGNSSVLGCTNSGVVKLTDSYSTSSASTGGIAGNAASGSIIAGCLNNSTKVEGYTKVGGIAGYAAGSITACHNAGPVTSIATVAGGILGGSGATTVLTACYATDSGTGTNNYGYIVGSANGSATFTECYYYGTNTATAAKGTKCADIETLNGYVEVMNTAINATSYTGYIFKAGADTESDLPTIIKN